MDDNMREQLYRARGYEPMRSLLIQQDAVTVLRAMNIEVPTTDRGGGRSRLPFGRDGYGREHVYWCLDWVNGVWLECTRARMLREEIHATIKLSLKDPTARMAVDAVNRMRAMHEDE